MAHLFGTIRAAQITGQDAAWGWQKQEGAHKPAVSGSGPYEHGLPLAVVTLPGASRTVLAWRSDDDTGRRAPDELVNATVFTLLG